MSRHRNIRNLTEDDYGDYYVRELALVVFAFFVFLLLNGTRTSQFLARFQHIVMSCMPVACCAVAFSLCYPHLLVSDLTPPLYFPQLYPGRRLLRR